MNPVKQIRTGPTGQCTEACIATLLGCPLEDVPDFGGGLGLDASWAPLHAWLEERRIKIAWGTVPSLQWPADLTPYVRDEHAAAWARPFILLGKGYFGGPHRVVGGLTLSGHAGLLWDPSPSPMGLLTVERVEFLLMHDQLPEHWRTFTTVELYFTNEREAEAAQDLVKQSPCSSEAERLPLKGRGEGSNPSRGVLPDQGPGPTVKP